MGGRYTANASNGLTGTNATVQSQGTFVDNNEFKESEQYEFDIESALMGNSKSRSKSKKKTNPMSDKSTDTSIDRCNGQAASTTVKDKVGENEASKQLATRNATKWEISKTLQKSRLGKGSQM